MHSTLARLSESSAAAFSYLVYSTVTSLVPFKLVMDILLVFPMSVSLPMPSVASLPVGRRPGRGLSRRVRPRALSSCVPPLSFLEWGWILLFVNLFSSENYLK